MPDKDRRDHAHDELVAFLRGRPSPSVRDLALFGLSPETQELIRSTIELSPALEESILKIADLAYADGADSVTR